MTKFQNLNKITVKLISSAGAIALIAGAGIAMAPSAQAWDCLLDTNNDGNADSNVDTDAGADSSGNSSRLACGEGATATGTRSTAVGYMASATATRTTAVGRNSIAAGEHSTALGYFANAAGNSSIAMGRGAGAPADDSTALGTFASADGPGSTALGRDASAAGDFSTALGRSASAAGLESTALGSDASAAGNNSTAVGYSSSAALSATALGWGANAAVSGSTALGTNTSAAGISSTALGGAAKAAEVGSTAVGAFTNAAGDAGANSTALGYFAQTGGTNAIAIGADGDSSFLGASAAGNNSIVIGADASDSNNVGAIVIGMGASASEADQIILKSADTFTILGNGDVGIGTAAPLGNLDINSGAADTTLLLSNTSAQWELKSKASTGRLNFKNLTDGGVPFKLGPSAVNSLLSVGTMADDLVEVRGELMVEGNVDVTGTLTTGGPTCGGGCDAVFGADYNLPSIEEHAKAMYANSYLPEIGPTVPHAPVNLSEQYGRVINELEKAHIYIAQINAEKQALALENQQQNTRLARLEALLGQ